MTSGDWGIFKEIVETKGGDKSAVFKGNGERVLSNQNL